MELDEQSGNIFWQEAIKHEIYSLIKMESFEFKQEQSQFQPWSWISMDNTDSDLWRQTRPTVQGKNCGWWTLLWLMILTTISTFNCWERHKCPNATWYCTQAEREAALWRYEKCLHQCIHWWAVILSYLIRIWKKLKGLIILIRKALYCLRSFFMPEIHTWFDCKNWNHVWWQPKSTIPMIANDHPELDDTTLLAVWWWTSKVSDVNWHVELGSNNWKIWCCASCHNVVVKNCCVSKKMSIKIL